MSVMLDCGVIGFVPNKKGGNIIYTLAKSSSSGLRYALFTIHDTLPKSIEPHDIMCCKELILEDVNLYKYETLSHEKYNTFP